jgi:single-strand DNA-binding protein
MVGRMVADPELKQTQTGISICNFRIAVNRPFKNASGEYEADFFNCKAWRGTGEFVDKYFVKGQMIAIDGRLETRTWQADDGTNRYATDIVVDNVTFAGEKKDGGQVSGGNNPSDFPSTADGFTPFETNDELPF